MLVKIVNGDGGEEDLTFKIESLKKILKLENVTEDNCLVLELDLIKEYIIHTDGGKLYVLAAQMACVIQVQAFYRLAVHL